MDSPCAEQLVMALAKMNAERRMVERFIRNQKNVMSDALLASLIVQAIREDWAIVSDEDYPTVTEHKSTV